MIKNIHMKKCAPYDENGSSLRDCKKINFIYGANGSGKSTISNFLMDQRNERFRESLIEWDGGTHADVKVYNRLFREQNFRQSEIPGVFTLGQATIEDIEHLEELKGEFSNKTSLYDQKQSSLAKKQEEKQDRISKFKNDAWNQIQKRYSKDFQEAFDGVRGSKERFYNELLKRIQQAKKRIDPIPAIDILKARAETLYSKKLDNCPCISLNLELQEKELSDIIKNDIWNTVIIGNTDIELGHLIKVLNNSDWINQGRKYLQEDSDICPFCQQHTISHDFRSQLEEFFDEEYKRQIEKIQQLVAQYTINTEEIINKFEEIQKNTVYIVVGKIDEQILATKIEILKQIFESNKKIINDKLKEPGRKVILNNYSVQLKEIKDLLEKANKEIKLHNNLVKNAISEKIRLTNDIWAYCIQQEEQLINEYNCDVENINKAIAGISQQIAPLKNELKRLDTEIKDKGKNITSVEPTVNEINRLLKAFGFTGFSIIPSLDQKNSYQLQRSDGSLATNTLSEGEETFIAFLYFMQLTKGAIDETKVSSRKIIVLDDPISSLDSTILYIVSAMVKELNKQVKNNDGDVEQVFIFTHNVFFHKEASFIDGRTSKLNDVNYWIIRKDNEIAHIDAYGMENPISTSYELLWRELKDNTALSLITMQNTMRRIIENYFGMLGQKKDDHIINSFETAEEQLICKSLLHWINDGSHSIPDDIFIDPYNNALEKYKDIFRKIFVHMGHEAHYNMMMGIEDSTPSDIM